MAATSSGQRFDYPGLIWTLVRTDFKVRYHGTVMGFFWALLKPTAMFLVLMAVFSFIFAQDPHYKLNLILGLFLWDFFAEATRVGVTSLATKGYLLGKTRFPSWVLVLTASTNALLTLAVTSSVALVALALANRFPSPAALVLFFVCLLALALIVLGISFATSALFLKYRDLNQVWDMVIHAGFFLAPVVYPLGILPEKFHIYLYLWPPTSVIQFSRMLLVEGTFPTARGFAMLGLMTATILIAGLLIFRRYGLSAAERL